jgi:prepilin peptidase CpaA
MSPLLSFLAAAIAVALVAAISDLYTGRIPNWLTLGGMLAGVVGHALHGFSVAGLGGGLQEGAMALAGLLFCSIAPGFLYWKGAMGGGDLKLFAAIGALGLPLLGIEAQMYSLLVAAIVAPARLAYEGRLFRVLGESLALLHNPFKPRDERRAIPEAALTWFRLGPAVFAGTVVTAVIHLFALLPP